MGKILEGTAQAKTQRGGTLWHCSTFLIQKLVLSLLIPPTFTEGKGLCSTQGESHCTGPLGAVAQEWAVSLTMVPMEWSKELSSLPSLLGARVYRLGRFPKHLFPNLKEI